MQFFPLLFFVNLSNKYHPRFHSEPQVNNLKINFTQETRFKQAEYEERKCSRTFAITCTTSFPGKIKVFDGALLTKSAFWPRKEMSFIKRAIFKIIAEREKQENAKKEID